MIKIEINDNEVQAAFKKLLAAGTHLEPVFRDIGEFMQKSTKDRFIKGEAPDGTAWKKNSAVTLARKKGSKPLIGDGGHLSTKINYALLNDGVEIGSPFVYAAMQQFGGSKSDFPHLWGDIPARPFLGISDADSVNIVAILTEHLNV